MNALDLDAQPVRGNLLDFGSQSRCVKHVLSYASPGPHCIAVFSLEQGIRLYTNIRDL